MIIVLCKTSLQKEKHIHTECETGIDSIIIPIMVGGLSAILVPSSVPLLGMLIFANLLKEAGSLTERLHKAASGGIMNAATIFLGLCVGATMTSTSFLNSQTLMIIVGGFLAFAISIAGGVGAVKVYNLFCQKEDQSTDRSHRPQRCAHGLTSRQ